MNLTITLGAAEAQEFYEPGDFFRLMETEGSVSVYFYKAGREVARAVGVQEGYSERFLTTTFDRVRIESATAQTVTFLSRLGNEVRTDTPPNGNVTVVSSEAQPVTVTAPETQPVNTKSKGNNAGSFTQAQKTVTNASGQLLAAKSNRAYLFVQNNDTTGSIYVTVEGTDATTALGLRIGPLGAFEFQGVCPSGAIKAIGDIASNANIIVLEG